MLATAAAAAKNAGSGSAAFALSNAGDRDWLVGTARQTVHRTGCSDSSSMTHRVGLRMMELASTVSFVVIRHAAHLRSRCSQPDHVRCDVLCFIEPDRGMPLRTWCMRVIRSPTLRDVIIRPAAHESPPPRSLSNLHANITACSFIALLRLPLFASR